MALSFTNPWLFGIRVVLSQFFKLDPIVAELICDITKTIESYLVFTGVRDIFFIQLRIMKLPLHI